MNPASSPALVCNRLLMRNPRIGILVVAYNAESTLRQVLHRIPAEMRPRIEEIFVFDDASQDRTLEVGQQCQEEWRNLADDLGKMPVLHIVKNPVNLMYGGNQKKGYQYAI